MTQKNINEHEFVDDVFFHHHDLEWYRSCVSMDMGNILDMDWFRNRENRKKLYSVKDIVDYVCSRFMGLKESLNEDSKLSLEKQIRRVMKKNFDLPKTEGSYKYVLGQAEVIYMVNELMSDYLGNLIYLNVKREIERDCREKLYKLCKSFCGEDWREANKDIWEPLYNEFEKGL